MIFDFSDIAPGMVMPYHHQIWVPFRQPRCQEVGEQCI